MLKKPLRSNLLNRPLTMQFVVGVALAFVSMTLHCQAQETAAPSPQIQKLIEQNCFECHGNGASEGNFKFDDLLHQPNGDATSQRWWKVLSNVRAGTMPPPDSGFSLTVEERSEFGHWLKYQGMKIDPVNPDPGRITIRRLNRREYSNTIRDLMGVEFNADIVFPPDDTGFGFDNVGDALSLSPMLVEKYVAAASEIVAMAVPKENRVIRQQRFGPRDFTNDGKSNAENMRMQKATVVAKSFDVAIEGHYRIDVDLRTHGTFEFSPQRCTIACKLDGELFFEGEYGWDESKHHKHSIERDWGPGTHRLEFALTPIELDAAVKITEEMRSEIDVSSVAVVGPFAKEHWTQPPGYHRFFPRELPPTDLVERGAYATEILGAFATRAYRRPAPEKLVKQLVQIAESVYSNADMSFESGISQAMISVLASPRFLFRMEKTEPAQSDSEFPEVDEYSLASRLSYFLWSTMPDEELFALAKEGRLRQQLDQQLERMLNDRRSGALIQNFVGQWLRTRDVEKVSIDALAVFGLQKEFDEALAEFRKRRERRPAPNPAEDPEFEARRKRFREIASVRDTLDGDVRQAMRRETEMLFEFIARENRSLIEIIDPGYTFLNEKLAKHYGVTGVVGNDMRRVELPAGSQRGGVLTQGSMLTVTSNPTRTSPVKRGLFILENILGTPSPPAPGNVPALEDAKSRFAGREPSLREMLAVHRETPLCSSCHSRMDPLGLALENFNALGIWRDAENEQPIDATGQLVTGEKFANVQDLRSIIANERRQDFYRCISQKMLTYALGRGLEYYDEHTLDALVKDLLENEGKYRTLIHGIVHSNAFQRQRSSND